MCDAIQDGGQRCASHTRPRFLQATYGTQEWDNAAADYAATPTGRNEMDALVAEAAESHDADREAALRTALRTGATRREAYQETRRAIAAKRAELRQAGTKNDNYWAAEMLDCLYSADKIVDRGEDLFFEQDNPVEIAAARQHIIDLDTAAEKLTERFKGDHTEIPWKQMAKARDRFAHHYDNINRDLVWNVLITEFPKIRQTLRAHLGI